MTNEEIAVNFKDHDKEIDSLRHRMKDCEEQQKTMKELVSAVDKLATNMEHMLDEQKKQGERILRLEQAPIDDYRHYKRLIASSVVTGVLGAVIGAVLSLIIK